MTFSLTEMMAFLGRSVLLVGGTVWAAMAQLSCVSVDEEVPAPVAFTQTSFTQADSNGDTRLSLEELARYRHREAIAEFDTNGDQLITLEEWKQARPNATNVEEEFNHIDINRDGKIDEEESVKFISANPAFIAGFQQLDANQDASIVWEEVSSGVSGVLEIPLFAAPEAPTTTPAP